MAKHPVYKEDMYAVLSDLLIYEIDARWSREEAVIAVTTKDLPLGTVLEKSIDGLTPLTTEGEAYAVLGRNIPASEEAQSAMILCRGVIIHKDKLVFETGVTPEFVATAITALNTLGIIAK